jgi:hypothetical protein
MGLWHEGCSSLILLSVEAEKPSTQAKEGICLYEKSQFE